MGAQSDFIAEQFVPSEQYKAQQMAMVQKLTAAGLNSEQLEKMFFIPVDRLSGGNPDDDNPKIDNGDFIPGGTSDLSRVLKIANRTTLPRKDDRMP
jgi:hypothetical protein